jgi:hypothetical protein
MGNGLDSLRGEAMITLGDLFVRAVREIALGSLTDESELEVAARICAAQAESEERRSGP